MRRCPYICGVVGDSPQGEAGSASDGGVGQVRIITGLPMPLPSDLDSAPSPEGAGVEAADLGLHKHVSSIEGREACISAA